MRLKCTTYEHLISPTHARVHPLHNDMRVRQLDGLLGSPAFGILACFHNELPAGAVRNRQRMVLALPAHRL